MRVALLMLAAAALVAGIASGGEPDNRCSKDAECVLASFDCGECSPCPDDAPRAMTPRRLQALHARCVSQPPARLDRAHRRSAPKCEACPDARPEPSPEYLAACVKGTCEARPARANERPSPVFQIAELAASFCAEDADCTLSTVDCSECGRCPDSPPLAVTSKQEAAAREACTKHPPARLDPKQGRARPACSPCQGSVTDDTPQYKAVCEGGQCEARLVGTLPKPQPGDLLKK